MKTCFSGQDKSKSLPRKRQRTGVKFTTESLLRVLEEVFGTSKHLAECILNYIVARIWP